MAIRKTRRQLVLDSAAIGAIYAAGWGQKPASVTAEPVPAPAPSPVATSVARLTTLIAEAEAQIPTATPDDRERLQDLLRCAETQCSFMVSCLDGSLGQYIARGDLEA